MEKEKNFCGLRQTGNSFELSCSSSNNICGGFLAVNSTISYYSLWGLIKLRKFAEILLYFLGQFPNCAWKYLAFFEVSFLLYFGNILSFKDSLEYFPGILSNILC